MPRLNPNEELHLRSLTVDFDANEMATLYKDTNTKGFIDLVELASSTRDAREANGQPLAVGSHNVPNVEGIGYGEASGVQQATDRMAMVGGAIEGTVARNDPLDSEWTVFIMGPADQSQTICHKDHRSHRN